MKPTESPASGQVGTPISRVDGKLKVTGQARYAADHPTKNLAYCVLVSSEISAGKITSIDTAAAKAMPGVIVIYTHENAPKMKQSKSDDQFSGGLPGDAKLPFADNVITYHGQYIAAVVAETFEQARHAARFIKPLYDEAKPVVSIASSDAKESKPKQNMGEPLQFKKGDVDKAMKDADGLTVVRQIYSTPTQTHNPMEMHATIAAWEGERLTVWDATQFITGVKASMAATVGTAAENVRVISPFVGGAFGCKGAQWPHIFIAAAVAKAIDRPVKVLLDRRQMFTNVGHRPRTEQTLTLAAGKDGKLVGLGHDTVMHGSPNSQFIEPAGTRSSMVMYASPNIAITHAVRQINIAPPTFMRAPGECPGMYALESAMDELAVAFKLDPVELRERNHADVHPATGMPWSSNHLKECIKLGAEKFGWAKRTPEPRSMKTDDGQLIGYGFAAANYPGYRFPSSGKIRLIRDGDGVRVVGSAGTHDLGTGAWTVFTQITATLTGMPIEKVKFELGDSTLPMAPVAGGSTSTASVSHALSSAADVLKAKLVELAGKDSPLAGLDPLSLAFVDEKLVSKSDPSRGEALATILARSGQGAAEGEAIRPGQKAGKLAQPGNKETQADEYEANQRKFTFHSHGAQFVEVHVDEQLARVRVARVVSVMDVGRVVNPKTARSQVIGGVVMGIGMALMEGTEYDPKTGRCVTDNLADYPVCVNPDIGEIDVHFIDEPDYKFNAIGCRGVGEIGITGTAAAVANAIYHATGKRVRALPITPDKLL